MNDKNIEDESIYKVHIQDGKMVEKIEVERVERLIERLRHELYMASQEISYLEDMGVYRDTQIEKLHAVVREKISRIFELEKQNKQHETNTKTRAKK